MSGLADFWDDRRVKFPADRFLEATEQSLQQRFGPLTPAAIDELKATPTLLAYEASIRADWQLATIVDIVVNERELEIEVEFDPFNGLSAELMSRLTKDLGFEKLEEHRTHWAIKDVDLADILSQHDLLPVLGNKQRPGRLGRYRRRAVLAAAQLLQNLGHPQLDDLLNEVGIPAIQAGREVGGRQARAQAIASWAMRNPDARVAAGQLLSDFLVERVSKDFADWQTSTPPLFAQGLWREFQSALDYGQQQRRSLSQDDDFAAPVHEATLAPQDLVEQRTRADANPDQAASGRKVFLVHGRDPSMKDAVARYLERLGLEPVILHEQPNIGRTIFSKFQEVAGEVSFAVVLLHPDDLGGLAENNATTFRPRARQNVILELGFFIGKLGAHRVAALVNGNVEKPSDFDGVVYILYGDSLNWKEQLVRELQAASIAVELSRAF